MQLLYQGGRGNLLKYDYSACGDVLSSEYEYMYSVPSRVGAWYYGQ